MIALTRMRLAGFLRGGRVLAPLMAGLAVLGILHGGGQSSAASAYGYSAAVLFPVFAWLTKVVLDTEPDVQRRLARVAVGPVREAFAGALAAVLAGLVFCAAALVVPPALGALRGPDPGTGEPSTAVGVGLGIVAHLLSLAAGVGLGALASRAVTRTIRAGVTVLAVGVVLGVVLGLQGSVAPWLVPPVMALARALAGVPLPSAGTFLLLGGWALTWCTLAFAVYLWLRRSRA
ncbi:hypothetical protein [Couchioplanes caeruleus]|uniref:ABC-2 type transport system permease protein n=2 Tax=Couchioplanes caeruleus TaxID=56438 RepID=A0A1K0GW12_9ACTN|nr:hypothetical protein [Couchioplanes caeruleus]OJF15572.1 hypothetical protein BG844_03600 [Couchioplanes caeruleus subsp. caeruleus]ROP30287.1 hypothetical protein EDD30_3123 [Couchioplanes caeruleus]